MEIAAPANLLDPSTLAQSLKATFLSSSPENDPEDAAAYEAIRKAIDDDKLDVARFYAVARLFMTRVADELAPLQLDGRHGLEHEPDVEAEERRDHHLGGAMSGNGPIVAFGPFLRFSSLLRRSRGRFVGVSLLLASHPSPSRFRNMSVLRNPE